MAFKKWVIISFEINYCFYAGNVLANHPGENNWTHLKKGLWVGLRNGHRNPARGISHLGHFWGEEFSCLSFLIPMLGFHFLHFINFNTKFYMCTTLEPTYLVSNGKYRPETRTSPPVSLFIFFPPKSNFLLLPTLRRNRNSEGNALRLFTLFWNFIIYSWFAFVLKMEELKYWVQELKMTLSYIVKSILSVVRRLLKKKLRF